MVEMRNAAEATRRASIAWSLYRQAVSAWHPESNIQQLLGHIRYWTDKAESLMKKEKPKPRLRCMECGKFVARKSFDFDIEGYEDGLICHRCNDDVLWDYQEDFGSNM